MNYDGVTDTKIQQFQCGKPDLNIPLLLNIENGGKKKKHYF